MKNSLFSRFGVELEYMIAAADTLDVRPVAEELIFECSGSYDGDVDRGKITWSNELAAHVIELKTTDPPESLYGAEELFKKEARFLEHLLSRKGCCLLPAAMHPWMDPARDTRLWSRGNREIYQAFDRIFNCRGHGWSNLQAIHLNLPFADENEFVRLHTAIRVLLPLLPALAASSPFVEGRKAPCLDYRLEVYRQNCARIPCVTGQVIPEPIRSIAEYERDILQPIYRELKPLDPEGILQEEWANARGAIARFERSTIEIRLLDMQECPAADLAILRFIVTVLKELTDEWLSDFEEQISLDTPRLAETFLQTVREGESAIIENRSLLAALNFPEKTAMTAREVWKELAERLLPADAAWAAPIRHILDHGTLATRLLKAAGAQPERNRLRDVYRVLADCLNKGVLFEA